MKQGYGKRPGALRQEKKGQGSALDPPGAAPLDRHNLGEVPLVLVEVSKGEPLAEFEAEPQPRFLQAPASVMPSTRTVGESVPLRNTRSLAGCIRANICTRLPATVISDTGSASAPSRIMNPEAPRL